MSAPEQGTAVPETICLICRSVLRVTSGFDSKPRWVHESGRSVWGPLHWREGGSQGYSDPMPLNLLEGVTAEGSVTPPEESAA